MLNVSHTLAAAGSATDVGAIPGLKDLWAETLGDPRVIIAVVDGPVDQLHPSLAAANLIHLKTLVSDAPNVGPASRHGTHIVSIIFGQHDGTLKGIAPRCRGLIVPIFKDGVDGIAPCSQLDLARAILLAVQHGAHIINISGGELSSSGTAHPLLADAVQGCSNRALIVAAAGNEGCDCLHIPGSLPSVLAVGAMNARGLPFCTNWGERYQTQGILALGENILGAIPGGGAATGSGTSYATSIVSGIAALLLSLQLKQGQQPNINAVRGSLLSTADGCEDNVMQDCRRLLAGRLNLRNAMSQIIKGGVMSDPEERQEGIQRHPMENVGFKPLDEHTSGATAAVLGNTTASTEGVAEAAQLQQPSHEKSQLHPMRLTQQPPFPNRVHPSACSSTGGGSCSCGGAPPVQLVFALGMLGYDFGSEARRDSILQHMTAAANPHDPTQLLEYLEKNPWDAAAILWTLNLDTTPVYAIQARGAFANDIYRRLRDFLGEQTKGEVERISVPGYIGGNTKLFTGQFVPVIWPEPRGMYSWNTTALVEAVSGASPPSKTSQNDEIEYPQKTQAITNFLRRIYDELRNLGITSQERALNYAATNAFQIGEVFSDAIKDGMDLETIEVERSPICRPESDCWDVKPTFFNPGRVFEQARKVYRFTVDVSDVVPVMVGPVRSWFVR